MEKLGGVVSLLGRRARQRLCWCSGLRHFSVDFALQNEEDVGQVELWSWGKGELGQLGLGDEETRRSPSFVRSFSALLSSPPASTILPEGEVEREQNLADERIENPKFESQAVSKTFVRSMHDFVSESNGGAGADKKVGIACGLFHSAMWGDGQLWMWGKGSGGRLGLGSEQPHYSPTLVSSLADVQCVALGGLHSAAIANGGSIYTWGFGGFGALGHGSYSKVLSPKKLEGEEWMANVKHVSAGGSHTAAISASGELYTWGRDEGDGRLGLGEGRGVDDGAQPVPVKVEAMPVPVAAVECGGFCTMALTPEGQLWSWGGNSNFELGRGTRRDDWTPMPIPEIEDTRIVQVACGGYHTAALTDDGKVLTWGHGGHGQLGHGDLYTGRVPGIVEALATKKIVAIACGSSWTAAVSESGELYSWGKNRDSQLGVPNLMDTVMSPILVAFEDREKRNDDTVLPHFRPINVSAGATHGLSLVYRTKRT